MPVKIVTDSGADLPAQLAKELDISIVPVYVRFGDEVYRDGVDISGDEFYHRLTNTSIHPTTSQPAPTDFANIYTKLAKETDEIVSIHLSAKTSGTCNAAIQGKEIAKTGCKIEIVDSRFVSMGLGLVAIAAARQAKAGASLPTIMEEVKQAIQNIRLLAVLDSLKYLLLGGRITKAKALVGTMLNVKPMLTMRDGELVQAGLARTRIKGTEHLYELAKSARNIQELAIVHSTTPDEAISLKERISSILDKGQIHLSRLSSGLGVHAGPGTLLVAIREKPSTST